MSKRKSDLTPAGAATISPNFISPNLLNNKVEDEMTVQLLGAGQEVSQRALAGPGQVRPGRSAEANNRVVVRLDGVVA
jgi:hypothetical protein